MRGAVALRVFLLIASCAVTPSVGQDLPVVQWKEMTRKGSPRALATLQEFANCILKRAPKQSAKFLERDYPSTEDNANVEQLAEDNRECLTTFALRFTTEYLRGALIEAAYQQPPGAGATLIRLGRSATGEMGQSPAIANCVVQRRPDMSAELLSTGIAAPESRRVLAKLQPEIDYCAHAANVRKVWPALLRFQVAEALYRMRSASPAIGKASK